MSVSPTRNGGERNNSNAQRILIPRPLPGPCNRWEGIFPPKNLKIRLNFILVCLGGVNERRCLEGILNSHFSSWYPLSLTCHMEIIISLCLAHRPLRLWEETVDRKMLWATESTDGKSSIQMSSSVLDLPWLTSLSYWNQKRRKERKMLVSSKRCRENVKTGIQ